MANVRTPDQHEYQNTLLSLIGRTIITAVVALPFLIGGIYSFKVAEVPYWASLVFIGVGALLLIIGVYLSFTSSFPSPSLINGEERLIVRHPSMRTAHARMMLSIPFFLATAYLFWFTEYPYVYPFVCFVLATFLFFRGAAKYWINLHVTYTVTNRRVINMYRFLWLHTTEIPVSRIISISEARSFFEILTGRGSVVVSSGIGRHQTIRIEDISDPGPVGAVLRDLLP